MSPLASILQSIMLHSPGFLFGFGAIFGKKGKNLLHSVRFHLLTLIIRYPYFTDIHDS